MAFIPARSSRLRSGAGDVRGERADFLARVARHRERHDDGVLIVIDLDRDDALPLAGGETPVRLGVIVERALRGHVRAGDVVARLDDHRFAGLCVGVRGGDAAAVGRAAVRAVENALIGTPEGHGLRVTAGVAPVCPLAESAAAQLASITTAMLRAKLLSDDRVVVAVDVRAGRREGEREVAAPAPV
ncbi:hypothetical protein ACVU7I_12645 [Patulibacter sp. S7RM1-6]